MKLNHRIDLLRNSGLFDEEYYLQQCPYIKDIDIDPIEHYLRWGHLLGHEPSNGFNSRINKSVDVSEMNGVNPLVFITENNIILPKKIVRSSNENIIKICIASSGIKGPTGAGGVAKCTSNLIDLIDDINRKSEGKKIELTILYTGHPYYHSKDFLYWKNEFESKYVNVVFDVVDTDIKAYGTAFMKRSYNILQYFNDSHEIFDQIIFHDFQGIGYYTTLAKKSGIGFENTKIIVNTHGNLRLSNHYGKKSAEGHDDLITMFMEAKSVENADYVVSPSQFYLDWWSDYANFTSNRSLALNNITNKEVGDVIAKKPTKKYNVTFFGRLEVLKGLNLFIDSILYMEKNKDTNSEYNEIMSNIDINFIGNSVSIYGQKSEALIKERCSSIIDKISIHLDFDTKKAFEFMLENNSLMVLPTLGETSSCVVSEAICNGVPYLASNIPGIKELVHPEYHDSNLFECGSQIDLIEKLNSSIRNPVLGSFRKPMNETIIAWESILNGSHELFENSIPHTSILIHKPLVSIIVPTYNRYLELDESLKSVVNQTYENIEVIVVDDGSSDVDAVKRICDDNGVTLISSSDKLFKAAACNLGVKNSSGKYVLFFDDDDLLHNDSVEKYVNVFENDNANTIDICSGFCSVFENEEYLATGVARNEYMSLALGNYASGNLISNYFGKGSFIIRREAFDRVGGYDTDTNNTHMVDYRFYVKATSSGLNVHIVPRSMYFYRKNSNGSLYYENANDAMKLFDAKSVVFNTIKKKVAPELHDMLGMLYFNHSYPRVEARKVKQEKMKWLSTAKNKIIVSFEVNQNIDDSINIFSSDKTLLCHLSVRYIKQELIINHKIDDDFQKEACFPVKTKGWLHQSSTNLSFDVQDKRMHIFSADLDIDLHYSLSHVKQKHIRRIVMSNDFTVI